MGKLEFTGKSVVITGAAAGMGKAITVNFLKNGATVVAVDVNESALDALGRELKENHPEDIVTALLQIYATERGLSGFTGFIDDPYTG